MKKQPLEHRLVLIASVSKDTEKASSAMRQLKQDFNKTYHWCPDWDFAAICDKDIEYECCLCKKNSLK